MKNNLKITVALLLIAVLSSCEVIVDLDTEQGDELLVIEGFISQKDTTHYIRLSQSGAFEVVDPNTRQISPSAVSSVSVSEFDSLGDFVKQVVFDYDEGGYFLPTEELIGQAKFRYDMEVVMSNGDVYSASETLVPIAPITDACYRIDDRERDDPDEEGYFYEVRYDGSDPQDVDNYYLFKGYRNDSIQNNDGTEVYSADDTIIGEELNGFSGPVYYSLGDTSKLELMGLSRRVFVFYEDLGSVLQNDGGMFNGIPANPRTNILKNGEETTEVFGVFQVSWVSEYWMIVGQEGEECDF